MLKLIAILGMLLGVSACAGQHATVPFSAALRGDLSDAPEIEVSGNVDTTGINFYSLIDSAAGIGSSECIPLILTGADQRRARQLHGRPVVVRGRVMGLADIFRLLPEHIGLVNGREWTGTHCEGAIALFVTHLVPENRRP